MFHRTSPARPLALTLGLLSLCGGAFVSPALTTRAAATSFSARPDGAVTSDRAQDGLLGPVRRVRTETARLTAREGKSLEGPRKVLETATYDLRGNKVDTAYFLAAGGTITGREVYKYDAKGNITEMSLYGDGGALLSKETYSYEFDSFGNWTKMTTSVAVLEGGKLSYEPTEVTYRVIAYYLDEATLAANVAAPAPKTTEPVKQPAGAPAKSATATLPPELSSAERAKAYEVNAPALSAATQAPSLSSIVVRDAGDAPTFAPRTHLKPVSQGVLNGKALRLPAPTYPPAALMSRVGGTVAVEVVIDASGKVISARAASGPPMLHAAAESAARQARFSPSLLAGQPVKVSGTINYNFTF